MTQHPEHITVDPQKLERSIERVRRDLDTAPAIGIIAGSGIAAAFKDTLHFRIPYQELPLLPSASVPGHQNELWVVTIADQLALILAGRYHIYEGRTPAEIAMPVVLLHALGTRRILLTNAAGGLNPMLSVGDLVVASSIVNMTFRSLASESRMPALELASPWYHATLEAATTAGVRVGEGTYVAVHGPSYETHSEIRFYRCLGDCIGMSTVHEAQAARYLGMDVLAVSIITNTLSEQPRKERLSHAEVLAATLSAHQRLCTFTECALRSAVTHEH